MTQPTTDALVELCKPSDEYEASMIVAMLADHEIQATLTGEFSAGFRAEAPGVVRVLVAQADLPLAQELIVDASKRTQLETSEEAVGDNGDNTNLDSSASAGWTIIAVLIVAAACMFLINLLF